ncbi:hypothetical protein PQX77_021197 [Marasmius sp. AFHP31]|nr:hypothetical protein PQX77_021197 [Marasmius sp. AFHP31]
MIGSYLYTNCTILVQPSDAHPSLAPPHPRPISHPTHTSGPFDSQDRPVPAVSTPSPMPSLQAQEALSRRGDSYTPGQRYASLLSAEGLGYPLWSPSPRCTDTGAEYTISIGDLGLYSDMYPFHTLFNITKPCGGIPDGNQQPKGVDPPCVIRGKVTVDQRYRENWKLLTQPPGSLSQPDGDDSRVHKFKLSKKEGALLMLPQGGVLQRLQKTSEFKRRILDHWRDWYEFAEEEGDLDETQTLCLLTSVKQCRNWAMAVWDPASSNSGDLGSLDLTADELNDTYSWARPPPRCSTQSSAPAPSVFSVRDVGDNGPLELKETVFIRAFWINRSSDVLTTQRSSFPPGHDENGTHDEDSSRHRHNSRRTSDHSQGPSGSSHNPFRVNRYNNDSPDGSRSLSQPLPSSYTGFGQSLEDRSTLSHDRNLPNTSNIVRLPATFNTPVFHPCYLINQLAFELVSKAHPSLLDSDCIAFSHDEDWISVLDNCDDVSELPKGIELLKNVCGEFKYVAEGDAIYTERMTPAELELLRNSTSVTFDNAGLIPVLFQLRERDLSHKHPDPGEACQIPDSHTFGCDSDVTMSGPSDIDTSMDVDSHYEGCDPAQEDRLKLTTRIIDRGRKRKWTEFDELYSLERRVTKRSRGSFALDSRKVRSRVSLVRVVPRAHSGIVDHIPRYTILPIINVFQRYAYPKRTLPPFIFHNELVPAAAFTGNIGWLGQVYLNSLAAQLGCSDEELWMDLGRGVICHSPLQAPSVGLPPPRAYLNIENLLPGTPDLLQEDVFLRFLASLNSKDVDRELAISLSRGCQVGMSSEQVHAPTVISIRSNAPIATTTIATQVWDNRTDVFTKQNVSQHGLTRFTLNRKSRDGHALWLMSDEHVCASWLSQAASVFWGRGTSPEDDLSMHSA